MGANAPVRAVLFCDCGHPGFATDAFAGNFLESIPVGSPLPTSVELGGALGARLQPLEIPGEITTNLNSAVQTLTDFGIGLDINLGAFIAAAAGLPPVLVLGLLGPLVTTIDAVQASGTHPWTP